MRLHRFYVLQPLGEEVVMDDVSIIKQWRNVFRYKKSDFVVLFDGKGLDVTYSVESISPKECSLSRVKQSTSYIPIKKITLYLSVIKKDAFELAVQKVTEIGVSAIIPILSERSLKKELNVGRLQKIAIEASEQCGRGDIPTILPMISLNDVLGTDLTHDVSYVLNMNGHSLKEKVVMTTIKDATSVGIFIGPEGGWSESDEELFNKNNIKILSLGETTLRAETAAIVSTAFILQ